MQLSKAESILFIYDKLRDNHYVVKEDILREIDIRDLTFRRYIADIRCYLTECRPYEEIIYRKREGVYKLKCINEQPSSPTK